MLTDKALESVGSKVKGQAEQILTNRKEYKKKQKVTVVAKIIDGQSTWEEDFKVSERDIETAENEIKEVITHFNKTLKPGERERTFVELIRFLKNKQ